MRRLFWTFPNGLPGAGLLLLRLATSIALLYRILIEWEWQGTHLSLKAALSVVEGLSSIFLLVGLGTPFWGAATAATELWRAQSDSSDFVVHCLLATLGASMALLGAGGISIDARVFGWKRIDVGASTRHRSLRDR